MSDFNVASAAGLLTAFKAAKSGDTIRLASGTYDTVALKGLSFVGSGVTITSANVNARAELTGLKLNNVSGLTFTNLAMTDKDPSTIFDFNVNSSSNIHFDHVLIQGEETGQLTSNPFIIRSSSNVSVTNSEIKHVRYGISMLDNDGVTLTDNYLHDIRTDGMRGGGNSNVTISRNFFTDFSPVAADHPDAIQFWTTNTTTNAKNVTITENVIMRGEGGAIQGIFLGDEAKLPYENVVIDSNIVIGGMYNGITALSTNGLSVTNNTVIGTTDQKSWIRVNNADSLTGNTAQTYLIDGVNKATVAGNVLTGPTADGGLSMLKQKIADGYIDLVGEAATYLTKAIAVAPISKPIETAVATITGTSGADKLKAGAFGDHILVGGLGNDTLTGGANLTRMEGGAGNDTYNVNSIRDIVLEFAGGGDDTVYTKINYTLADHVETLRLAATNLTVHGNELDNRVVGSAGVDIIYGGGGADNLQALVGHDILYGETGDDNLSGGDGDDILSGGIGNDNLTGDAGFDILDGGDGVDWLEGGAGPDTLTGGGGADTFNYRPEHLAGRDTITDFSFTQGDKIGLSLIDANSKTAKNDAFTFIGSSNFSHVSGQLHYTQGKDGIVVEGDTNGDGAADFSVFVKGVTHLAASDFTL
jgi:Ca2+-binding RTX toxin-like protein